MQQSMIVGIVCIVVNLTKELFNYLKKWKLDSISAISQSYRRGRAILSHVTF